MTPLYRRNPVVELAPMEGEAILFHPQKNQFVVLNRTSAYLWSSLEEPSTAENLAAGICRSFSSVALPQALSDVRHALNEFVSLGVVLEVEQRGSSL